MGIEFGMPALIGLRDLEETAGLCRELGLAFVELNMNLPPYQVEELEKTGPLRDLAARFGIYFTIHLEEGLNPCDFNRAVAEAYRDTVRRTVEAAKKIGAPLLNMHLNPGVHFSLPDRRVWLFEQYPGAYLEGARRFRALCEEAIGGSGILMAVENTGGFTEFQKKALEILLDSPVFALTWDIGHSHAANDADEPFFLQNIQKLRHFHIHDADGERHHLALGAGGIDLAGRLALAKKQGCRCVVETKTPESLRESVKWLEARGWKAAARTCNV